MEKTCTRCREEKSLEEFYTNNALPDRKTLWCKSCTKKSSTTEEYRERLRAWRKNNPEKLKEYYHRSYHKNKEKRKEAEKKYRKKNKEKRREAAKRYREKNKHRIKEYFSHYYQQNKASCIHNARKYQATRLKATPDWLTEEQIKEIKEVYWLAQDISKVSDGSYHVDHIIPLQGEDVCGLHVPWNLQVLPSDVNIRKGNKHLEDF